MLLTLKVSKVKFKFLIQKSRDVYLLIRGVFDVCGRLLLTMT